MMKRFFVLSVIFLCASVSFAQHEALRNHILSIIQGKNATVGVAVLFDGKDLFTINDNVEYPMQSVFKLHIAMAILDHLEKNRIPSNTEILITSGDLMPDTHSPLREKYPQGNVKVTVKDLIRYATCDSDNNACDILLKYVGGPQVVEKYVKGMGIDAVSILASERDMSKDYKTQYTNWTKPSAAVLVMNSFIQKELFSPENKKLLETSLIETKTGQDKIKALLPEDLIIGHKTGNSSRNIAGLKGADNDLAFVRLPDGSGYSIAIFIKDSMESDAKNAELMARISRVVFEHYVTKDM